MSADHSFPRGVPPPSSPDRPTFDYRPADMDAEPAVTIVTPYYNTGEAFRETALSVMRQTMQQLEWIIVNDGSSDEDALTQLAGYRDSDPRIRVIDHQERRGAGAARNSGFREARAEYVVQLDSDDLLEPTMVEKLFWFLQSYPQYSFAKGYTVGFGAESYVWVNGFHTGEAFLDANHADVMAMVRRSTHLSVGGYDESNRKGLEDWDFWLKCAAGGYWGGTVHEPLSWYRRRESHGERWEHWDDGAREEAFRDDMKIRYAELWDGGFPRIEAQREIAYEPIPDVLPVANELRKDNPRILMIVPWMTMGGADKFNIDAVEQLTSRGWEVTIATTLAGDHSWETEFARFTSDIFPLHRFLRPADYPRFLSYLIGSRAPDVVLVSNSELGYQLLPYLRARHPEATFMDLVHAEQEDWKSGGHANFSNIYRDQLDLTVVVSAHLRSWMVSRGGDGTRIAVCHLGVDIDRWQPDDDDRNRVRTELQIDEDVPVILYAGRLAEEKQPKVFAETMLQLSRSRVDFAAIVAGDGEDREWLESFVADRGLDRQVKILGRVNPDRMVALFHAADVLFLPSRREGIALSMYEAMACGVPVVGAAVGGQRELVTPETGILLERNQPDREAGAYANVLGTLLADADRQTRMGRHARDRIVDVFSLTKMGDCLSGLIDQARSLHEASPRSVVPVDAARASATLAIEYQRTYRLLECSGTQPTEPVDDDAVRMSGDAEFGSGGSTAPGNRVYAALMKVFGGTYRRLKNRDPKRLVAWRDRTRRVLGYRR